MFRYENPQKNRYREFIQAGAEIVGTIDKYSDLKVITPYNFRTFKGHVWNLPHNRKVIRV